MNTYIYSLGNVTVRVHASSEDRARVILADKILASLRTGVEIPSEPSEYELVAAY